MVTRRAIVALAGGAGLGGISLATYETQNQDGYQQTFRLGIVSEISFEEDGMMSITFREDHGSACFAIWHASDDVERTNPILNYGCGPQYQEMPRYGGTVSVDLVDAIRSSNAKFPTRAFKLLGFNQRLFGNTTGKVRFRVPEDLMPNENLSDQ